MLKLNFPRYSATGFTVHWLLMSKRTPNVYSCTWRNNKWNWSVL